MATVSISLTFDYELDPSKELIETYAVSLADKYARIFAGGPSNPKFQEWFQAAAEGVCEAAMRWNVSKSNGAVFTSYAHYWILATARKYGLLGMPSRAEGYKVVSSDLTDLLEVKDDHQRELSFIPERLDVLSILMSLLRSLDDMDRFLIQFRFGLPPFVRAHTFDEIASICGISDIGTAWNKVHRAVKRLGNVVKREGLWSVLHEYLDTLEESY